jgi:ketosteroid isomerase-like protein
MKFIAWLFSSVLFLASCSDNKNEVVNVGDLSRNFTSAWNTKNTGQLDSLLADDVQFLQAHNRYRGKSEVSNRWIRETVPTLSNLRTSAVSSGASEDIAYEGGTFSADVTSPDAGAPDMLGEGNYVLVWKKIGENNWKLVFAQIEGLPLQNKEQ